tara:strand:+ start:289 stop:573 length:285 start_codon:yes stop_codon:yes gene_type:complete
MNDIMEYVKQEEAMCLYLTKALAQTKLIDISLQDCEMFWDCLKQLKQSNVLHIFDQEKLSFLFCFMRDTKLGDVDIRDITLAADIYQYLQLLKN